MSRLMGTAGTKVKTILDGETIDLNLSNEGCEGFVSAHLITGTATLLGSLDGVTFVDVGVVIGLGYQTIDLPLVVFIRVACTGGPLHLAYQ